jgi:hypothetical protein
LENPKSNPHADGIVGSSQMKSADLATSQMKKLVIQQPMVGPTSGSTTPTTQYLDVHSVQMKTLKGPQQPREKKKGKGKKGSGGNNKKYDKNVEGPKMKKGR